MQMSDIISSSMRIEPYLKALNNIINNDDILSLLNTAVACNKPASGHSVTTLVLSQQWLYNLNDVSQI